jgi:hypothetical protein
MGGIDWGSRFGVRPKEPRGIVLGASGATNPFKQAAPANDWAIPGIRLFKPMFRLSRTGKK